MRKHQPRVPVTFDQRIPLQNEVLKVSGEGEAQQLKARLRQAVR